MRKDKFGDSYCFVKRSLLQWLGKFGEWSVHPMFTEPFSAADVAAYERLLGARVVSTEVLTAGADRRAYLACTASCGNLFLDPSTGLRMKTGGRDPVNYLFASELLWLAGERPGSLTMVFDQSLDRNPEKARSHVEGKLQSLRHDGLFGYAYVSHASFVVVGRDPSLVERSRGRVLVKSGLLEDRLLRVV